MEQFTGKRRRATYADLEAVPPHRLAELIGGELHVTSRGAPRHAHARSVLSLLLAPFGHSDVPGGWWGLDGPELHFPDPGSPGDADVLVPDLAGWRRERMPELPDTDHVELAPDWVCEVLTEPTEELKRALKMPVYAREGVQHAWLVDLRRRTLEVYSLVARGAWALLGMHREPGRLRIEPFEAVEFDLGELWGQ
ncbi:Uma2 family endonuclease [Sorangium sp. So ce1151]|uniref:Uma2 family endonuclease n=1 Tax=Sorangium sp. So ce1151 TaxID=3133332 RepID=UPI003F5FFCF6